MNNSETYIRSGIYDHTECLAIFADLSCKKISDIEYCKSLDPLYIVEHRIAGRFPMTSDPDRMIFSFKVTNKDGEEVPLKYKGWSIKEIHRYYYNWDHISRITVVSPEYETRVLQLRNLGANSIDQGYYSLESINIYLDFLKEFQLFHSWAAYDMNQKNIELEEKVKSLTNANNTLKQTIAKLNERIAEYEDAGNDL